MNPAVYDLKQTFGDARETVLIIPILYPLIQFRVQVGKGWSEDGFEVHSAILRDYLDAIQRQIEDEFCLEELVAKIYPDPKQSQAWKTGEWDCFECGCRWEEE